MVRIPVHQNSVRKRSSPRWRQAGHRGRRLLQVLGDLVERPPVQMAQLDGQPLRLGQRRQGFRQPRRLLMAVGGTGWATVPRRRAHASSRADELQPELAATARGERRACRGRGRGRHWRGLRARMHRSHAAKFPAGRTAELRQVAVRFEQGLLHHVRRSSFACNCGSSWARASSRR